MSHRAPISVLGPCDKPVLESNNAFGDILKFHGLSDPRNLQIGGWSPSHQTNRHLISVPFVLTVSKNKLYKISQTCSYYCLGISSSLFSQKLPWWHFFCHGWLMMSLSAERFTKDRGPPFSPWLFHKNSYLHSTQVHNFLICYVSFTFPSASKAFPFLCV